ncbi:B-box zinc finger protein [Chryseobacterium sp. GP-SGM7]|uniref:B-box zinc finger protein n=1 Tax=Chryseobacterium sp. GP-SGM7 TaxID=3411323 RepID=UPI003B93E8CF
MQKKYEIRLCEKPYKPTRKFCVICEQHLCNLCLINSHGSHRFAQINIYWKIEIHY